MAATPASQWKGKIDVDGGELSLPSGNVALVRNLSPVAFLSSGFMPDYLSSIVRKAINTKKGIRPQDLSKLTEDPKQLGSALETFDRVLVYCVVEPEISMPPGCEVDGCGLMVSAPVHQSENPEGHPFRPGTRLEDTLYADQIDMNDKIFVFQWALGGTRDLEQFREQQTIVMESLSDEQDVQHATKRTAGRKRAV